MTSFTITVDDKEVQDTLKALSARVGNMRPVLHTIGEGIVERTKRRFETSTGPDGVKWKPNSAVTLMLFGEGMLSHRNKKGARSYSYSKQGGELNAKGMDRLVNKKPLIADGDLRRQFTISTLSDSLTVGNTMKYAAIQQFGGKAGRGRKVTIPARPFLPIHQNGTLYPAEQAEILSALNAYLTDGL